MCGLATHDRGDRLCLVCRSAQQMEAEHQCLFDCLRIAPIELVIQSFQRACSAWTFCEL